MKLLVKILILLVIAFMLLGAIMVFTASGTYSFMKFNNLYYLFKSHLWKVLAAGFLFIVFANIPYDIYRKYTKPLLIGIIVVLILTYFLAPKVKGAARWIDLGFIQFQPSEAAKLILIMHLAMMIEKFGDKIADFKNGFVFTLIWIAIVSSLVLIQPNVSTSLIIVITGFAILYVGGARFKHISFTFLSAIGLTSVAIAFYEHAQKRIISYVQSFLTGTDNIQVTQAKIALGSGGLFGVGLGHSRQSDLFLPESYGDFIFSILGEELGLIGTFSVLLAYLVLFVVCLVIAKKAQDKFGQLLVFGLGFNILISALINAGVVTGLLPTTGITLPFISFGGTSIILFAISTGIIVNVALESLKTEELRIAQVG